MLSKRLAAIVRFVTPGKPVVDVGCDHAFLPIYLVENEIIPWAVASDLRPGPLSRAEGHIKKAGLENKIKTVLYDGVPESSYLDANTDRTLVIAGMGGLLMRRILTDAKDRLGSYSEGIFEPQSDIPGFRSALLTIGWRIEDEAMVLEDGKFYTIMKTVRGCTQMSYAELYFGPVLLQKKDHVFYRYLKRQMSVKEVILKRIEDADGKALSRADEVKKEIKMIKEVLDSYEVQKDNGSS